MGKIVSYTWDEMDELAKHSQTDWERVKRDVENDTIDFSDIPELDENWFKSAKHMTFEEMFKLSEEWEKKHKTQKKKQSDTIKLNRGLIQKLKALSPGWRERLEVAIEKWIQGGLL